MNMKIKDIEFPGRAFLAPMAGVADRAFREVCASFGAAYTVTEMVSAKGLSLGDKKSAALLTLGKEEGIAGAQIFGDDPAVMALAAVKCLEYKPDIIDINMGCPAPKVANNGGGASLMKNPRLAGEIVRAVSDAVDIPVTVKIRKGWDDNSVNAVEMAQIAEQNGAAAIAVHGAPACRCTAARWIMILSAALSRRFRFPLSETAMWLMKPLPPKWQSLRIATRL